MDKKWINDSIIDLKKQRDDWIKEWDDGEWDKDDNGEEYYGVLGELDGRLSVFLLIQNILMNVRGNR